MSVSYMYKKNTNVYIFQSLIMSTNENTSFLIDKQDNCLFQGELLKILNLSRELQP